MTNKKVESPSLATALAVEPGQAGSCSGSSISGPRSATLFPSSLSENNL